MKLYGAPNPAPNPRRVRIFLAEKGIDLPETPVNMMKGEHKSPDFKALNSLGQLPTLVLDDGAVIAETVSICRYLEELHPDPPLFGVTALDRAQIDMWIRRVEFQVQNPVRNFWLHAHPRTAALLTEYTDFGQSNVEAYGRALKWLDGELAGKTFIHGEAISMADICAETAIDFATWIGLERPPELANLAAWHERMAARPSSRA